MYCACAKIDGGGAHRSGANREMDDAGLEVENISNCGDDLNTCEQPAAGAAPVAGAPVRTASDEDASEADTRRTTATVTERVVGQTSNEAACSRIGSEEQDDSRRRARRDSSLTLAGRQPRDATLTFPGSNELTNSQSPAEFTSREREGGTSGAASSLMPNRTIASPLIEEPPPLYCSLFPAALSTDRNAPNSRQPQSQNDTSIGHQTHHQHHQPFQHPHRCNICYPVPPSLSHSSGLQHSHHHLLPHTGPALPGAIGQHYPEHHTPRQLAQYHSTILPMHHQQQHGVPQTRELPDDYLKLSFVCVLLCTIHLNLPALLCVLPALAYSIRTQKLNSEGRYRQARRYSRSSLTCNLLAFCQYVVVVVAVAIVLYVLFNDSL